MEEPDAPAQRGLMVLKQVPGEAHARIQGLDRWVAGKHIADGNASCLGGIGRIRICAQRLHRSRVGDEVVAQPEIQRQRRRTFQSSWK